MKQTQVVRFTLAVAIATLVSALSWAAKMATQERKQPQTDIEKMVESKCEVLDNGALYTVYNRVNYGVSSDGYFVITSVCGNPNDYSIVRMFFDKGDEKLWYSSVLKCTERLKNWILVSQKNKIKEIEKKFPNISVKTILDRKKSRNDDYETPPSGCGIVEFKGSVQANDQFNQYEVSISAICDGYLDRKLFNARGTIEAIDKEIDQFLMFVNPETLLKIYKKKSAERDLFQ